MLRAVRPVLIAAGLLAAVPVLAVAPVPLKKGDRIIFLGDSITAEGEGKESNYVKLVRDTLAVKHKSLGVAVIGACINGNKVPDLLKRVEQDVIAKKPTVVFVFIGINDVKDGQQTPPSGTPADKYEAGLKQLIDKIKKTGARVVLCTPGVIGEKYDGSNPLDKMLDEYADLSRKAAKETKVPVCDLRKAFVAHLKENNVTNKSKGILTRDGIELNAAGNRFVAEQVLTMFGD